MLWIKPIPKPASTRAPRAKTRPKAPHRRQKSTKVFADIKPAPAHRPNLPLRAAPLHGVFAGQVSLPAPSGRESRRETKADTSKPTLTSAQMTAALLLPRSHQGDRFNLPFKGIPAQAALSFAYYKGHVCAWNTNAGSPLAAGHRLYAPRTSVIACRRGCKHLRPYREGCSQHSAAATQLLVNRTSLKGTAESKCEARASGGRAPSVSTRLPKQGHAALPRQGTGACPPEPRREQRTP